MEMFKNIWTDLLLLLVALLLVVVLFLLRGAILNQQTAELVDQPTFLTGLRRQVADWIAPASLTPTPTPVEPTATPTLIVVTLPPPTPTATVTAPEISPTPTTTDTWTPPFTVTPTPTPIPTLAPSETPIPPTTVVEPSPTPAESTPTSVAPPLPATSAPAIRAAYRIGYLDRGDRCEQASKMVQTILEQEYKVSTERIGFATAEELFATLAIPDLAQRIDLTLCYTDPLDRKFLQKHFGFVILVGKSYRQSDGKRFIMLSNGEVKKELERNQPCLYRFLSNFTVQDEDLVQEDAIAWYNSHNEQIAHWTQCK
jgi:hypothetical protein